MEINYAKCKTNLNPKKWKKNQTEIDLEKCFQTTMCDLNNILIVLV